MPWTRRWHAISSQRYLREEMRRSVTHILKNICAVLIAITALGIAILQMLLHIAKCPACGTIVKERGELPRLQRKDRLGNEDVKCDMAAISRRAFNSSESLE